MILLLKIFGYLALCCKVEWDTICPMSASPASSALPSHAPPAAVIWGLVSRTDPKSLFPQSFLHLVLPMTILPPSNSTPQPGNTPYPLNSSPTWRLKIKCLLQGSHPWLHWFGLILYAFRAHIIIQSTTWVVPVIICWMPPLCFEC